MSRRRRRRRRRAASDGSSRVVSGPFGPGSPRVSPSPRGAHSGCAVRSGPVHGAVCDQLWAHSGQKCWCGPRPVPGTPLGPASGMHHGHQANRPPRHRPSCVHSPLHEGHRCGWGPWVGSSSLGQTGHASPSTSSRTPERASGEGGARHVRADGPVCSQECPLGHPCTWSPPRVGRRARPRVSCRTSSGLIAYRSGPRSTGRARTLPSVVSRADQPLARRSPSSAPSSPGFRSSAR